MDTRLSRLWCPILDHEYYCWRFNWECTLLGLTSRLYMSILLPPLPDRGLAPAASCMAVEQNVRCRAVKYKRRLTRLPQRKSLGTTG